MPAIKVRLCTVRDGVAASCCLGLTHCFVSGQPQDDAAEVMQEHAAKRSAGKVRLWSV